MAEKGLSRGDGLTDARGVLIEPGDAVIYGFGVGRSVAMAEGVIRDDGYGHVSTTTSGRVWVTIVRRSYGKGTEERVHVAPDRIVVLKATWLDPEAPQAGMVHALPDSPLPTQDLKNRTETSKALARNIGELRGLLAGAPAPEWIRRSHFGTEPESRTEDRLHADAVRMLRAWITERRATLMRLEARVPCCERPGATDPAQRQECGCGCHLPVGELGVQA